MPATSSASDGNAAGSPASMVSHRVSSGGGGGGWWYPLHHLARWSGSVSASAPVADIKRAMSEAKAAIDSALKKEGRELDQAYRKIGPTVCVSEEGCRLSVQIWTHARPSLALRDFAKHLEQTIQEVFHDETPAVGSAAAAGSAPSGVGAPPAARAAVPMEQLCSKYAFAFDASAPDGSLASASLAASAGEFSLAAFLDQHLQAGSGTAATEGLDRVRGDLDQLRTAWRAEQATEASINPSVVAAELQRVQVYHGQLVEVAQQQAAVQQRLERHLEAAKPMHAKVATLQRNMAFIQHVQLYEQLLRQATELSDRCLEALGHGHADGAPHSTASPGAHSTATTTNATPNAPPVLDAANVQAICGMFLKLLRLYQGLQESTRSVPARGSDPEAGSSPTAPWKGVPHLHGMLRRRILTILAPLKSKLIQLYQQTLTALNWPQTTNTLLLGLANGSSALSAPSSAASAAVSPSPVPPSPSPALSPLPVPSPPTGSPSLSASSAASSSSAAASSSGSGLDLALRRFELLSENLVRVQMLLVECGLADEVRAVEREIQGVRSSPSTASKDKDMPANERRRPCRLWVLSLLLQPIYKRFYYHFDSAAAAPSVMPDDPSSSAIASSSSSGSLTNRLDKPEWVCTFLEKAYRDHADFLERRVQPIVTACKWHRGYESASFVPDAASSSPSSPPPYEFGLEFLERLLGFYHAKLSRPAVLHAITSEPALLRHTLQELVSFEAKLAGAYGYPVGTSRRLTLLEPFLRGEAFQALLKAEKAEVNRGLDRLRNLERPWDLVASRSRGDGNDSDDEEEPLHDDPVEEEALDDPDALTPSAARSATHSAHGFLSLVSSLTSRSRSFKYLNHRLHVLKEIQFKLFEIYEEDLIRAFQQNWTLLLKSAKRGGLARLAPARRGRRGGAAHDPQNPVHLWATHCGLLNSIAYCMTVLREWDDEVFFLELFYFYTHRPTIMATMLKAAHQLKAAGSPPINGDHHLATPIGGVLVHQGPGSAGANGGAEEEEILVTSEELALWMANGGSATFGEASAAASSATSPTSAAAAAAAKSTPSSSVSPTGIEATPSSSATEISTNGLPVEFQQTVAQLAALSRLGLGRERQDSASTRPEWLPSSSGGSATSTPALVALTSPTPTSDQLFPLALSSSSSSARRVRSTASTAAAPMAALPAELGLSGTLFEPILASYASLREEMLHSLVQVVAGHFRDGLRAYARQGHMARAAFSHPDLVSFFHGSGIEPDWTLLERHVDLSSALCAPLLDLQMQLLVVSSSLCPALARSFWTVLATKISAAVYEDAVASAYFTRSGALQFVRDCRAIFALFHAHAPVAPSGRAASGRAAGSHFKLVQDALNILLLSSDQLDILSAALTGELAAASVSTVRTYLARSPTCVQKLSAAQVLDLVSHVREDEPLPEHQDEGEAEQQQEEEEQPQNELYAEQPQDETEAEYVEEDQPHSHEYADDQEPFDEEQEANAAEVDDQEPSPDIELEGGEFADEEPLEPEPEEEEYDAPQDQEQEQDAQFDDAGDQADGEEQAYEEQQEYLDDASLEDVFASAAAAANASQVDEVDADAYADAATAEEQEEQPDLTDFGGFPEVDENEQQPEEEEPDLSDFGGFPEVDESAEANPEVPM